MENIIKSLDTFFKDGLLQSGLAILFIIIITIIINHILNVFIKKRFTHNAIILQRIKKGILWIVALIGILLQVRSLQSVVAAMLASGGILAVTIGLASQEAASGIINGFMILFSKPYKVGDMVYVIEHNVRGKVIDITLRHSVIETLEKTQMLIPNTIMNKTIIENISNVPNKKGNYLFIDISYESDLEKAIFIIQEEAGKHPYCIDPRSKKEKDLPLIPVYCLDFKENGVSLRATVYSKDNALGFDMLSDLRKSIKKRFQEEGIEIPYPHRTIIKR